MSSSRHLIHGLASGHPMNIYYGDFTEGNIVNALVQVSGLGPRLEDVKVHFPVACPCLVCIL